MSPYEVSLEKNLARRRDSFINLPYDAAPQSPTPLLLYSHRNHNIMIHSFSSDITERVGVKSARLAHDRPMPTQLRKKKKKKRKY